jgi:hypothetical protein
MLFPIAPHEKRLRFHATGRIVILPCGAYVMIFFDETTSWNMLGSKTH